MAHGLTEAQESFVRALWRFKNGAGINSSHDYEWRYISTREVEELVKDARRAFGDFDRLAQAHHELELQEEMEFARRCP